MNGLNAGVFAAGVVAGCCWPIGNMPGNAAGAAPGTVADAGAGAGAGTGAAAGVGPQGFGRLSVFGALSAAYALTPPAAVPPLLLLLMAL